MLLRARFGDAVRSEHGFSPSRRWRLDFALPAQKIGFEYEGGIFANGRHSRGLGLSNDAEKYNAAQLLGWRVFRFTSEHFKVKKGSAPGTKSHVQEVLENL